MTTKLEKPLKREIVVNEEAYTLTIAPDGLKLVPKGKRNGQEYSWKELLAGSPSVAPTSVVPSAMPPRF